MDENETSFVICTALRKHDPIGRVHEDDSYQVESTILARRFSSNTSVAEWRRTLHDTLQFWSDEETAGSEDGYQALAEELWLNLHPL